MYLFLEKFHDLIGVDGVECDEYVLFAEMPVCLKKIRVFLLHMAVKRNVAKILVETEALIPLCLLVFTFECMPTSPAFAFRNFLLLQQPCYIATLLGGKIGLILFFDLRHGCSNIFGIVFEADTNFYI